ncbi:MAG TPA: hypothetical protein VIY69_11770 [Candidatus Acidoferrales bacterium]
MAECVWGLSDKGLRQMVNCAPSTMETIPEKRDHAEAGNFNIPAPIARKTPVAMKNDASTSVKANKQDSKTENPAPRVADFMQSRGKRFVELIGDRHGLSH